MVVMKPTDLTGASSSTSALDKKMEGERKTVMSARACVCVVSCLVLTEIGVTIF